MAEKLNRAFPIVAYPLMTVLPDGGLSVAAGNSLVRAGREGLSAGVDEGQEGQEGQGPRAQPKGAGAGRAPAGGPYPPCSTSAVRGRQVLQDVGVPPAAARPLEVGAAWLGAGQSRRSVRCRCSHGRCWDYREPDRLAGGGGGGGMCLQ